MTGHIFYTVYWLVAGTNDGFNAGALIGVPMILIAMGIVAYIAGIETKK